MLDQPTELSTSTRLRIQRPGSPRVISRRSGLNPNRGGLMPSEGEARRMSGRIASVVYVGAALLIAALVMYQVVAATTSPETQAYLNESEEWCEERGGELWNAKVMGPHGGLHCELPNGTDVHMSEVVE